MCRGERLRDGLGIIEDNDESSHLRIPRKERRDSRETTPVILDKDSSIGSRCQVASIAIVGSGYGRVQSGELDCLFISQKFSRLNCPVKIEKISRGGHEISRSHAVGGVNPDGRLPTG